MIAVRSPAPAVDPSTKAKLPLEVELKLLLALANQFFKFTDVGIVEVITQFKDPVAELFVIFQSVDLLKSEDHMVVCPKLKQEINNPTNNNTIFVIKCKLILFICLQIYAN